MKRFIYSLLITSITGSAVYASGSEAPQRPTNPPKMAPQRPTTPLPKLPPLKTDNSICPDELKTPQLNELKDGTLKLGGHNFKLHTSKTEFDAMLAGKKQADAKISNGQALKGRAIISDVRGHILKCTYSLQEHKTFAITSEPTALEKDLPKGLAQAIVDSK